MDDAVRRGGGFSLPGIKPGAAAECQGIVIIPVRDEASTLEATLRSLAAQAEVDGRPLARSRFEVIVLANNCRDGSADLARRFARLDRTLALHVAEVEFPAGSAHVGTARKWLMDEACRRLIAAGSPRGVIASTDGDTRASPTWMAETWAEVARGADAVGGDIRTDRAGRSALDPQARRSYLQDVSYRRLVDELASRLDPDPRDPWPRHHHHTGASLAITAEAYRKVGGLPPLRSSEDLALVAAVRRSDLQLRHGPKVRVVTSTRRLGRATGGMADTLRDWSKASEALQVESPLATEARLLRSRKLREFWRSGQARLLDLDPSVASSPTLGAFLESIEREMPPSLADGGDRVPIHQAITDLRHRLATLRRVEGMVRPVADFLEQVDPVGGFSSPLPVF